MKLSEAISLNCPLLEGISPVLFHATSIKNLINILETNRFHLTAQFTKPSESNLNSKMYFFSTSRTRTGRYHLNDSMFMALIQLDGRKLSNNFSGEPVDYWGRDFRQFDPNYEQEDRITSNKPYIENAISYIERVDILLGSISDPSKMKKIYDAYVSLRKRGIPVRIYKNNRDWITGSTNSLDFESILKLNQKTENHTSTFFQKRNKDNNLTLTLKLLKTGNTNSLSKEEKRYLYNHTNYFHVDKGAGLIADFHNATSSPQMRNILYEISVEMRKRGIRDVSELSNWIYSNFN